MIVYGTFSESKSLKDRTLSNEKSYNSLFPTRIVYFHSGSYTSHDRILSCHETLPSNRIGRSGAGGISSLKPGQICWISTLKRECLFHLNL